MTKEEWAQAEKALQGFYSSVRLKVDEYEVTLILERVSTYKNMIMVYIGGEFKGKWLAEDCEERRRFFSKKARSLLSAKQKADFKKLPKRTQKDLSARYNNLTYETYSPQWSSFSALKKHFISNNQQIELVKIS